MISYESLMNSQQNRSFIPGLQLAELFFVEQVKPILDGHFPTLRYSAAMIGSGSEVLGFDTEMSSDHHWGPRAMLFLETRDYQANRDAISTTIADELPAECHGYPTNWSEPDMADNGTQGLVAAVSGPVRHRVEMFTLEGFFQGYLNTAVGETLTPAAWLSFPFQKLRSVVSGRVFHDDLGLEAIRAEFTWYPYDVWLYILACAWTRIGQEEHLMGRAGFVDDEIGSALIGSRLVRDIIRLAFLMEKAYPPYPKWLGTAFAELKSARELQPVLLNSLHASTWREREEHLSVAYEYIAGMHKELSITKPLDTKVSHFFGRPFKIIHGDRFAEAILACITDPQVAALNKSHLIGSIDLFSDNTDLLEGSIIRAITEGIIS